MPEPIYRKPYSTLLLSTPFKRLRLGEQIEQIEPTRYNLRLGHTSAKVRGKRKKTKELEKKTAAFTANPLRIFAR